MKIACWAIVPVIASALFAAGDYADPGSCAACHPRIAATYARTAMARAFHLPDVFETLDDYYHAASRTHLAMIARDGRYFQRRWQTDAGGSQVNVEEKSVDFVMGSGNHVRTFLHRTASGALQQLPLAWYAERGGYFAMNPGYDKPDQPDARRTISYECMFCHNAYPQIPNGQDQLRADPIFAGELPQGIDCQRCHGPARRHVELARAHAAAADIRSSIVNPARLTPQRQMDVCAQCHLETTSFPLPHSIRKYGRATFSFRPGEPLYGYALFFDTPPSDPKRDRFQIVSAVYRLKMSACFLKSGGELKCTTCHDPHTEQHDRPAYNAACRRCHATLGAPAQAHRAQQADCAGCHMPPRRTDDVVHAVMTDHYIQRKKPDRDLLAAIPEPHAPEIVYHGEVVPYDPAAFTSTPENELYLALAQVREESNLKPGLDRLARAIRKYTPSQADFYVEFADALLKDSRPHDAAKFYREALRRNPQSLAAELGLGSALDKSGDLDGAAEAFRRASGLAPASAEPMRRLGETLIKLHRTSDALDALEKSLEFDPEIPETHYALATLYAQQTGDLARAAASYREAIRLQPAYSAAHMNLAIVLFRQNRAAEAGDHFEQALVYHPDYALGHYNYGLMLIAENRLEKAREQLKLSLERSGDLDSTLRQDAERRLRELSR